MKDWRRRKAQGLTSAGQTAHIRYGKFSRAVVKSLELVRPPLSDLDAGELDRLEGIHEEHM